MSMTVERPPAPAPAAPPESSRRAWLAVLAAPFVFVAAVIVGFAGAGDWALLPVPIPIVAGFMLGLGAARTGNGVGALAAATAAAEAAFLVMFHIGANVIEFHSDGTSLLLGVASAVAAFAVTALALHRLSSRHGV